MEETASRTKWGKYYENQKILWYDPTIPIIIKAVVRFVELHRSDSRGWSISTRKSARLLGVSRKTVMVAIKKAIDMKLLETTSTTQRKRRKLRLCGSLRAPVEWLENNDRKDLGNWGNQPGLRMSPEVGVVDKPLNSNSNIKTNNSKDSSFKKVGEVIKRDRYKELREFAHQLSNRKQKKS